MHLYDILVHFTTRLIASENKSTIMPTDTSVALTPLKYSAFCYSRGAVIAVPFRGRTLAAVAISTGSRPTLCASLRTNLSLKPRQKRV